jgi:hypothetical protein
MFEVFAGPQFTLLAFGAAVAPRADDALRVCVLGPGGIVDTDGHARRAFGIIGDALVLVRPDNHIALITSDPSEVTAYLDALAA